ncbi:MAG: hypothetical protein LKI76_07675 [Megasphaera sp.]|jgi:nitroimidazol reductase NimA-like FMN-containing flavoprotein (pyridoxamine 5'-phosphate oxidase superfamily)|uniref:pyridoxamine 5'-phosphate oxidase family protein n=1 Tax=Megasphaera sueciensis TaxID=349094 RepID=UPI003D068128|nr:hypothetical protein [Megasphaera sp.]
MIFFGNFFDKTQEGNKLDNIRFNNRILFCVVGHAMVLPSAFTTKYESAIVFGNAVEVVDDKKNEALLALLNKYSSRYMKQGKEYIKRAGAKTKVIKINIEHLTGKANR